MHSDTDDTIREIVADLEDLRTSVEELQVDPPEGIDATSLDLLETALEQATQAADELEDPDQTT